MKTIIVYLLAGALCLGARASLTFDNKPILLIENFETLTLTPRKPPPYKAQKSLDSEYQDQALKALA